MTQSKKDDLTITLSGETLDLNSILDTTGDIVINLDNTYGTTTTYLNGASDTYTISLDNTISITDGIFTVDTNGTDWLYNKVNVNISPDEVEKMCKEYPGLEKVWQNFKSVYDMCKQDYEGKKRAGELDE
jgi:hypothetical protein